MQPYHTLKGSRQLLLSLFKVCGNPDAPLSHFEGVEGFVKTQVQPYHTLKGSRSLLLSLFKVCGNPDAPLSQFEEVDVTFA